MRITDAVALVTGASCGLGEAIARTLAAAGARLIAHGRDEARLATLAHDTGAATIARDLAKPRAPEQVAAAAAAVHGRLDLVIHNAGIGWAGPFATMPPHDVHQLLAVNLAAPIMLTRTVLPGMIDQGGGYHLFVCSIAGRGGVAGEAVYAATKAGLDLFAESLRLELRGSGVDVGVLVPGVINTPFFDRRGQPYARSWPRPQSAARVAEAALRCVSTSAAQRYSPRWLRLPVAVRAVLPGAYRGLATRYGTHPSSRI